MGYDVVEWKVVGRVSRHNAPKDHVHDDLWDELCNALEAVALDPKYADVVSDHWDGQFGGEARFRSQSGERPYGTTD